MGLKNKWPAKEWAALLARTHPDAKARDARGRRIMYWCPDRYLSPQDWLCFLCQALTYNQFIMLY